ncbi:MAG: hypothetical protein ACO1OB_27900 [Archangium sp.]
MHEALLRASPIGAVMWLKAAGKSLWPLLRDGDSLRVQRIELAALRLGELAVVKLPGGVLAAHIVVSLEPLETESIVGVKDPSPVELLARVTAFRRNDVVHEWPSYASPVLRFLPSASRALKSLPGLRRLIRFVRDGRNRKIGRA